MQYFGDEEELEIQDDVNLDAKDTTSIAQFNTNTNNSQMANLISKLDLSYQTLKVQNSPQLQQGTGLTQAFAKVALTEPQFEYNQQSKAMEFDREENDIFEQQCRMKGAKVTTQIRRIKKIKKINSLAHSQT